MLTKGLVITNAFNYSESTKYQVERLTKEFNEKDVILEHKTNIELLVWIEQGDLISRIKPDDYKFIIYLDKDKYISLMLEKLGFKLFNSSEAIQLCDDKMLTHIKLSNLGIKMPKTMSYPLCYIYNNNYSDFKNNIIFKFSFPFIIKENYGSLGKQVYLISNYHELINVERQLRYKPHIYQDFISESSGVDYRLLLIGHEVVASMKRVNESNFKANIALGGKGYKYVPSNKMEEMAVLASKTLNLDYCAIDFVLNKNNEPLLIEVNSNAFFTEIEKVSSKNIAKLYVDYILKNI